MTLFHSVDHVQLPVPVGSAPVARHEAELPRVRHLATTQFSV